MITRKPLVIFNKNVEGLVALFANCEIQSMPAREWCVVTDSPFKKQTDGILFQFELKQYSK